VLQNENGNADLVLQKKCCTKIEGHYNKIQSDRAEKLNVFDLLTLDKIRQGILMDLPEASVEKLQREGLIKLQSSAKKQYLLGDLYYEIAQKSAYVKEYLSRDIYRL